MEFSHEIFLKNIAQTTGSPILLEVEKAAGSYLYSPDGKAYLDLISGVGVNHLGHQHPHIINRIKEQVDKHLHVMVYGEFVQSTPNLLAKKLTELLPPSLNCCYFTNSGTEANEGALKLVKRYTGRTEIISCRGSYHGSTHGSLSVSGNETKKQAFRPLLPDVKFVRFNNMDDLKMITTKTACIIMETVQGDAGVRVPSQEYMTALRAKCDDTGTLIIFDEIQAGMGRTGKMFAFEHFNIVPDILTTAKALGGGLPIGAFISSYEKMTSLTHDPMLGHITTFGGNPASCAAALGVLEVFENENIVAQVEAKGQLIESLLQHHKIIEIRRKGMMFAIDFASSDDVFKIAKYCLDHGVITFWFLSCPNSFRISPPLNISEEDIRKGCAVIQEAFNLL
ncbi:aspartate aminotransferase family protein [Fulvivirga sediminis]|uniref:Aspartate aminotransferase family protein n=1 Tax=Fulvivirga sediminis TaxID=2803949 RepID=A0A937K0D7_9BACT|nr:aspartate aminotransferase family protein [Fulvivirga sediminis]MBL3657549.1 aspartate aminotransferase family protein [Fulvivirga sediminis]